MKKLHRTIVAIFLAGALSWVFTGCQQGNCPPVSPTSILPGLQGLGITTPAGRGGQVIRVTNLGDSGPGSLRAAIDTPGPRVIVFEISGTITLLRDLIVNSPYLTIAGQTAPSPGITLRGAGLQVRSHDILVQHLRIRVGDGPDGPPYSNRDALSVIGPEARNIVLDHMSLSWAIDENLSTWFKVANVTIANSIISEGLHRSLHNKGPHSKGILFGNQAENVVLTRNFITQNHDRYPLIKGGSSVLIMNNLCFNSGTDEYIEIEDADDFGPSSVAVIGNVFVNGEDTPDHTLMVKIHQTTKPESVLYLSDNQYDGPLYHCNTSCDPRTEERPLWTETLDAIPSADVEHTVLLCSGARPRDRDSVDQRLVASFNQRIGRIIDSQNDVGGWPQLAVNIRTFQLPDQPHADHDCDGYSNLEEFLHALAETVSDPACYLQTGE